LGLSHTLLSGTFIIIINVEIITIVFQDSLTLHFTINSHRKELFYIGIKFHNVISFIDNIDNIFYQINAAKETSVTLYGNGT